jgi:hypothetical protein
MRAGTAAPVPLLLVRLLLVTATVRSYGRERRRPSFDVTFKRPVETLRAAFKRMRKDCSFDQERPKPF